jgi:hypothetical protein
MILVISLASGLALVGAPAAAQDAEALRRELEQLQQQFKTMQEQYQKAIDSMTERLQRLEARPPAAPAQAAAAPAPPARPGTPSLVELARPREPFALYERRGAGQLLFDFGLVADFVGNLTSSRVEREQAGTFAGRENRVFPREVELNLYGQIDPYAFGVLRIEAAEEFEDGERAIAVNLADAYLTLTALPFGFQLKGGFMRTRFGLLNEFHREALPQTDQPNVLTRFFGEEGLRESGAELSWVAPLPVFLEALVGVFNGDNEEAFGRGSLRDPLVTGRLRTFLEFGEFGGLQLGVSGAHGVTEARTRASYLGFDAKYKYTPAGWRYPLLTLGGEVILGHRKVAPDTGAPSDDTIAVELRGRRLRQEADGGVDVETRNPYGYYVWAEVQPFTRWAFGARYDWTELPDGPGQEWAIGPYFVFKPSDFLRFRLGYKHTERSDFGGGLNSIDELLLQATFFLGAHQAHPF